MLKVPSTISKVMTMHDKSLRVQVDTQELGPEDAAEIMRLKDAFGYFVFSEQGGELTELEIKKLPKIKLEEKEKSPSERLRAVMFVYWEKGINNEPFDTFYRRKVEDYIMLIKEKIRELE